MLADQDASPDWCVEADRIVARVQTPEFPDLDLDVTTYGATPDGRGDCTAAFAAAIEACHAAGGGRVVVPAGVYRTGSIHLRSHVDLHLEPASILLFDTDPAAYLPLVRTRWQGIEAWSYSPLIYAVDCTHVAITGTGTLDGQADHEHWWPWSGLTEHGSTPGSNPQMEDWPGLEKLAADGVDVDQRRLGPGWHLRPSFVQLYRCTDVNIEGITIIRSPMWQIHPVLCERVRVAEVTLASAGPNNDGCDPECCTDVVITGCHFAVGDDCVAIKSGRGADGLRVGVPSRNVVIEDCVMRSRFGAVTLGSELTGGIENVYVRRCRLGGADLHHGLHLKTNATRGGFIRNVNLDRIEISRLSHDLINCDFTRGEGPDGPLVPQADGIRLSRVEVGVARRALTLIGFDHAPIRGVELSECTFGRLAEPDVVTAVEGLVVSASTAASITRASAGSRQSRTSSATG